jgi:hypothetical protein
VAVCKATSVDKEVRKVTSGRKPDVMCYRCGKPGHCVPKCRVSKEVTCHQCGKTGHLQRACQSGKQSKKWQSNSDSVCHVEEEFDESQVPIFHVGSSTKTPPYKVTVQVDSCDVKMEVDTGSSVMVISKATYVWPNRQLSHCKYRLRSYLEEPITVLGCMNVEGAQTSQLPLIVVDGDGPNLLGRNWLVHNLGLAENP